MLRLRIYMHAVLGQAVLFVVKGELTGQDAWFFSFLSLVFSLLAGATFEFQYGVSLVVPAVGESC